MKKIIFVVLFLISVTSVAQTIQIQGRYPGIINNIIFLDDSQQIGFIGTANGLFKTTNGGENWFSINGNLPFQSYAPPGNVYTYTHPITMIQTNDGKLIYALYSPSSSENQLFVTQNGGLHWSKVIYPKPLRARYIRLTSDNQLILYNGYCLYKKNSISNNFEELSCPNSETVNYVNNNLIYTSPSHQKPLENFKKSIDGGRTWVNLSSFGRNSGAMNPKIDVNENVVFILKEDSQGQILVKSIDNGLTWAIIYEVSEADKYTKRIHLISHDKNYEYIGFSDGSLYKMGNNSSNLELFLPSYDKHKTIFNLVNTLNSNKNVFIGTGFGLYKQYPNVSNEIVSDDFFEINGFTADTIYKKNNSTTIFARHNSYKSYNSYSSKIESFLSRSDDDGITWKRLKIDQEARVISIGLSELNTMFAITWARDNISFSLYKSLDNGDSWIKLRNLKNSFCDEHSLIIESDQIYCSISGTYTSLYNEDDETHDLNFNGKNIEPGNIAINNEKDIGILTLDGIYKSNDGGGSWKYLGKPDININGCYNKFRNNKNPQNTHESCTYINENKILYITRDNNSGLAIVNLNRIGNTYVRGTNKIPSSCKTGSNCDINYQIVFKSESEYLLLFQSTIYKSIDGGNTWKKGVHLPEEFKKVSLMGIDKNQLYFIARGNEIYNNGLFKINI